MTQEPGLKRRRYVNVWDALVELAGQAVSTCTSGSTELPGTRLGRFRPHRTMAYDAFTQS